MKLHFLSLIGVYNALTVSDELKALVNFDQWAQTSLANHNFSGKVPAVSTQFFRVFLSSSLLASIPTFDKFFSRLACLMKIYLLWFTGY